MFGVHSYFFNRKYLQFLLSKKRPFMLQIRLVRFKASVRLRKLVIIIHKVVLLAPNDPDNPKR